jgi:hypothetical protein
VFVFVFVFVLVFVEVLGFLLLSCLVGPPVGFGLYFVELELLGKGCSTVVEL